MLMLTNQCCLIWIFSFGLLLKILKMRPLGRRFHTLIKNVSFPYLIPSPTDHNPPPFGAQRPRWYTASCPPLWSSASSLAYFPVSDSDTICNTEPRRRWIVRSHTLEKGLEKGASASEDTMPWRGVDCEIPYQLERGLEKETSASDDAGPQRGWIVRSQISWRRDWRREWVPARTLSPKESGLWDPTLVGEGNETFFTRV